MLRRMLSAVRQLPRPPRLLRLPRLLLPLYPRSTGTSTYDKNCISTEEQVSEKIKKALPGLLFISVVDISGGCGDMYEINVEAKEFSGLSRVKQHQLVTEALKVEIGSWHGVRINTSIPPKV